MRGIITLIGLNLLIGCNVFGWTPPQEQTEEVYNNMSSKDIKLVYHNDNMDTLFIASNSSKTRFVFSSDKRELLSGLIYRLERYEPVIELLIYQDKKFQLVKKWKKLSSSDLKKSVNSPFNHKSWVYKDKYEKDGILKNGKIIFTITDKDFKN